MKTLNLGEVLHHTDAVKLAFHILWRRLHCLQPWAPITQARSTTFQEKIYPIYIAAKALKTQMLVTSHKPHCTLVAICTTWFNIKKYCTMHTQFTYEFYVIHTVHFSYIQNALSKMEQNIYHTTQLMLHANSLMFQHQGDILREFNNNKWS